MDRHPAASALAVRVFPWSAPAVALADQAENRFEASKAKGRGYPCVYVTWYGAAAYCNFLSEMEGLAPCYSFVDWSCDFSTNGYRLPTEAEWELAARGGLAGKRFPWGDTIDYSQANFKNHPDWRGRLPFTSPPGSFPPNGYGLYDMAGNVAEYCNDHYIADYYLSSPNEDPTGPATGTNDRRVLRGGSWDNYSRDCRVSRRSVAVESTPDWNRGFRPVRR